MKYGRFSANLYKIEKKIMDQLHDNKMGLIAKYPFGNIGAKFQNNIEEVYINQNTKSLSGKDAREMYEKLKSIDEE